MNPEIGDALFDFSLALRLDHPDLPVEADPLAAVGLLPTTAGLPLNAVGVWPVAAQAGLLQLLEVWLHVDAIARGMGRPVTYPANLTARSRSSKLGVGMVAWLRGAGPSLATMVGELDALRQARQRLLEPQAEVLRDAEGGDEDDSSNDQSSDEPRPPPARLPRAHEALSPSRRVVWL